MDLTKSVVKAALGVETDAELARFFEIGRWAVGQWPDDMPIPERRQWELRARRPDLFAALKAAEAVDESDRSDQEAA